MLDAVGWKNIADHQGNVYENPDFRIKLEIDVTVNFSIDLFHRIQMSDVKDEKLFFRIIRAAFSQRRKQIINPLSGELGISKQALTEIFASSGIKQTARAEELTLADYARLCNNIDKHLHLIFHTMRIVF